MAKKIIKLKESDLFKIVNDIITEQVQQAQQPQQNTVLYTDNFDNVFESGRYQFTPSYLENVTKHTNKLIEFIKGKQLNNFKIIIQAGESKVTNQAPFDKKEGSLANARAEYLKQYLTTYLQKVLNYTPTIEIADPIIGTYPYTRGVSDKDDINYKKEQFIKVNVVADYTKKPTPTPTPTLPPVQNPNKGFVINVRGDMGGNVGAYYFPKNLEDWKKITYDPRLRGFYASAEQSGQDNAQTTVDMNDNVFKEEWLSKAPDLKPLLGPAYLRDPKNYQNFILKK
jgi:hypothetical protein